MTFVYDEINRNHTLDGKHIGSVSQIIAPLSDFGNIPPEKLERKRQLGIEFHEAIRLYLFNDLLMTSVDPDLRKPMKTFINWANEQHLFGICEAPIHHKTLKYCGKPDLTNGTAIYDWKLRPYNRLTDTLQLEAYKHMITRKKLALRTVCFDIEGKMTIHDSYHPKAWGIFRKMLERYYSELEFYNLMESWKGLN